MIIVMRSDATAADIEAVVARIEEAELTAHRSNGPEQTVIWVMGQGDVRTVVFAIDSMPGLESVYRSRDRSS